MAEDNELQAQLDEFKERLEASERANQGLKADLAKAKAKAKGAEIDPEAHAALQTQVEELQGKLEKVTKDSTKQIEKLTQQLTEKDGAVSKYLIDSQLTDQLAKAGVKPEFMDAAKALLKSQAAIKAENGEYTALIGDKAISEAIKEWASGDQGKHFIAAPDNTGGGAKGGNGGGTVTKKASEMTVTEKTAFIAEHGVDKWSEKLRT
jgi:DNA repair exonuclease SbcCD ATPase subunit